MQNLSRFFIPRRLAAVLCALAILIAAILLFLSEKPPAASSEPTQQLVSGLSGSMQATLSLQQGDFLAQVKFSQRYTGDCSFVFFSPSSLDGISVECREGRQTLSYNGITTELPADSPAVSMTELFLQGIRTLCESQNLVCEQNGETTVLSLTKQQTPVLRAEFDTQTGTLRSLSLPLEEFSATIDDLSQSTLP